MINLPLHGIQIHQVEPGTVVVDPKTGVEFVVDEKTFLVDNRTAWVTPTMFEKLKQAVP